MEQDKNLTVWQRLTKAFGPNSLLNQDYPTYKFDKTELLKTTSKQDYEREKLQAQQTFYLGNQWAKIETNLYSQAVYYEPTRLATFYDLESMEFCLHGDTKIATPDGFITIKELADKGRDNEFIVYSYDHNEKRVIPAKARNAHYTRDEMTYKITFDDGNHIIATWEHQLMMRDGSFERVMNLKPGDSMMPFYRRSFYNNQKYHWVYSCNSKVGHHGWVSEHNLIAEWFYRPLESNEVVHHCDFNGKNNNPENLLIMDKVEHQSYHAKINNEKLWANPEYREKMKIVARSKKNFSWNGRRAKENNPAYFSIPFDNIIETARQHKTLKKTAVALGVSHVKIQRDIVNAGYKDWSTFLDAYNIEKSKYSTAKAKGDQLAINHKIVSIEPFGVVPVYDITVPGYKNFATDTIFSHNTPEISAALDIYSEESTTVDENGFMLQIYSESKRIKSVLADLFNNVLDINTNLPMWIRNMTKYGDNFVYLKLDPEKGIVGCTQLPNIEIERFERGMAAKSINTDEPIENKGLRFKWKAKDMEFNTWEIAHFRLLGDDRKLPYGTSALEKARRVWKQLLLAEDAMLIYRTSRAPERRVFKVFVGNMDDKDVEPYVQRVANKFKRDQVVDNTTGNVDMRFNQMAVDQDYFIPVRDPAAPSPIETLPGACIALDTRIPLLDGRVLELQQIIEEWDNGNRDLWVYSCNPLTGELAPGMITWAGTTRKDAEVIKITLDNGESIITTPDHKWVHRTKGFVEAQDLVVGDSLMPFYRDEQQIKKNTNKYDVVWDSSKEEWVFTHRMVVDFLNDTGLIEDMVHDQRFLNESKTIRHHKDHNRYNNNPSNIVWMNGVDHMKYHQYVIKDTIWKNPEENKVKISSGVKRYIDGLTDEEKQQRFENCNLHTDEAKQKRLISFNNNPNKEEILRRRGESISESKSTIEFKEKFSETVKQMWEDVEYREKVFSKKQTLTFTEELYQMFFSMFNKTGRADLALIQLNNSAEFMNEFVNPNVEIRSSLTNLEKFTHNHLEKMLKERGFKNYRDWSKTTAIELGYKNLRAWRYYIEKENKKESEILYNHKIVAIEYLNDKMDTGTITVDGDEIYHNFHTFAVESGVFIKNSNLGEIADIEYIQKKLLTALRVPKAFLGFEEPVGGGKDLSLMDIRFARTINKIQKCALAELNKIAIIHLFLLGFEDELRSFTLNLTNPSSQADLLKIDVWKEKMLLYKDAVTPLQDNFAPVSASWAKKHILGFSDEEIKLDLQQQRIERAVAAELTNTATVITHTGLFDNIDKLYGTKTGGTQTVTATPPPPPGGEPSDMGLPPMPPPPGPEPGGEAGVTPEGRTRDNLSILLENSNLIEEEQYIDLSKARNSLGDISQQLDKLLND